MPDLGTIDIEDYAVSVQQFSSVHIYYSQPKCPDKLSSPPKTTWAHLRLMYVVILHVRFLLWFNKVPIQQAQGAFSYFFRRFLIQQIDHNLCHRTGVDLLYWRTYNLQMCHIY